MKELIQIKWKKIEIGQTFIISYNNGGGNDCRKISKHKYKYIGRKIKAVKITKEIKKHIFIIKE